MDESRFIRVLSTIFYDLINPLHNFDFEHCKGPTLRVKIGCVKGAKSLCS